jgi:hypothetical protein
MTLLTAATRIFPRSFYPACSGALGRAVQFGRFMVALTAIAAIRL